MVWLAPVALAPLLVALAREAATGCAASCWAGARRRLLVRRLLLDSVRALRPRRLGDVAGWAVFLLFCVAKALHLGVFALFAGILMRALVGDPRGRGALGGDGGDARLARLRLAGARQRRHRYGIPLRLAPFTGVYGLSFVFAMMATALALAVLRRPRRELRGWRRFFCCCLLPQMPPAERGREAALLVQPNISETEQWTAESLDRPEAAGR